MNVPALSGIRAVLFDVLHTLVDDSGFPRYRLRRVLESEDPGFDAARFEEVYNSLTAKEYDWEAAAVEEPFRTMKERHAARLTALYRHLDLEGRRDLRSDIEVLWREIATSRVYPEVPEVLPVLRARGYRLGLVTNADVEDPVLRALETAGIDADFDVIATSEGVGRYKPDPSLFRYALNKLELGPDEVLMVGDNPASDVMGAKNTGIAAVWVDRRGREFPDGYPPPDSTVRDLIGLLQLLPGPGFEETDG